MADDIGSIENVIKITALFTCYDYTTAKQGSNDITDLN
jgi:hypothetical protein